MSFVGGVQTKQKGFDERRHRQLVRSIIAVSLALTASGWFGLGWSDDFLRFPMCQFVKLFVVAFEEFVEDPRLRNRATFLAMAQRRLRIGSVIKTIEGIRPTPTTGSINRYRPRPNRHRPDSNIRFSGHHGHGDSSRTLARVAASMRWIPSRESKMAIRGAPRPIQGLVSSGAGMAGVV